jgi:hypothetical protein
MSNQFDYSKLNNESAEFLKQKEKEINKLMEDAGTAFCNAGLMMIGKDATSEQISNLLSNQWGHDKEFILEAMNRVKRP